MRSCLFVADQISKQLSGGGGNLLVEELPPALVEHFGGQLQDVIASLGDLSKIENEAQVFAQVGKEIRA